MGNESTFSGHIPRHVSKKSMFDGHIAVPCYDSGNGRGYLLSLPPASLGNAAICHGNYPILRIYILVIQPLLRIYILVNGIPILPDETNTAPWWRSFE